MIVNKISSLNFKAQDYNKKAEKADVNKNKRDKILLYSALGLCVVNTALLFKKTSQTRLKELIRDELLQKQIENRKFLYKTFNVESFTDKKEVASIDDLAGLEQLKEFINKYKTLSDNRQTMKEHNIEPFTAILLWGVPGTGKTSAAMGIAKKLDADFIRLDKELFDSEFISKGPRQLAEYFRNIKEHANKNPNKKLVVFMDEIDSTISIDRGLEAKQDDVLINTLKQGITDLQRECENVIFIGATNKDPSGLKSDNTAVRLNTAILSRFNYQFELELPQPKFIKEAWEKLVRTQSGKAKFNNSQNNIIAQKFYELGMSYRDIKNAANKMNIEDAVEYCKSGSYDSAKNLINVLKNDEKIGYDAVKKESISSDRKKQIIDALESQLKINTFY